MQNEKKKETSSHNAAPRCLTFIMCGQNERSVNEMEKKKTDARVEKRGTYRTCGEECLPRARQEGGFTFATTLRRQDVRHKITHIIFLRRDGLPSASSPPPLPLRHELRHDREKRRESRADTGLSSALPSSRRQPAIGPIADRRRSRSFDQSSAPSHPNRA